MKRVPQISNRVRSLIHVSDHHRCTRKCLSASGGCLGEVACGRELTVERIYYSLVC